MGGGACLLLFIVPFKDATPTVSRDCDPIQRTHGFSTCCQVYHYGSDTCLMASSSCIQYLNLLHVRQKRYPSNVRLLFLKLTD